MKYMLMFVGNGTAPEPGEKMSAAVGEWWEKHARTGAILGGERLQDARTATTVETRSGVVTDGPFLEAKESIGGYAIIDVEDLDAAVAMAKTWPGTPKVEIRPLADMDGDHD